MENFRPQNIEPKKDDTSKQGKSFAKGLRNVVVAGLATLAMSPQKGEAQAPKTKDKESIIVHDKKDNRLKAYKDSLRLYKSNLLTGTPGMNLSNTHPITKEDLKEIKEYRQTMRPPVKGTYLSEEGYKEAEQEYQADMLSKRTKIMPTRIYNGESGEYYYKKPVQKVEYKPETEENTEEELLGAIEEGKEFFKYYDNKAEYEKALQEYNDSLDAYNQEEEIRRAITKNGDKNTEIPGTLRYLTKKDKVPEFIKMRYKVMPTKIVDYMIGDKRLHTWLYDKPLAIPKLRESKSLGSINVHGRKIEYTSEEQKNEILQKLKEYNISASKVGDSENYTVTRFQEKTKGWQGNKLLDETGAVLIDLDK